MAFFPSWASNDSSTWHSHDTLLLTPVDNLGLPRWCGQELTCQCWRHKKHGFYLYIRKIPWRRARQPTPVFLLGESHWQRSLQSMGSQRVGYDWSILAQHIDNLSLVCRPSQHDPCGSRREKMESNLQVKTTRHWEVKWLALGSHRDPARRNE